MPIPAAPDPLRRFVDDEMLRAPLLVDTVIDAAFTELRNGWSLLPPRERAAALELQQEAQSRRPRMVQRFVESLREQVAVELRRDLLGARPPPASTLAPQPLAVAPRLAIVDDDTVAADVELSNLIEAVKDHTEHELREIATYTSALLGDRHVARDHNPFRPEVFGRALWEAAQALPATRGYRIAFLRHASQPLGQVLRKAYASACSRLEAAGVEPAVHRTLVHHSISRHPRLTDSWQGLHPDLHLVRDRIPEPAAATAPAIPTNTNAPFANVLATAERALREASPQASAAAVAALAQTWRARLAAAAPTVAERQTVELLCRLFEALAGERQLAPGVPQHLAFLLIPALRVALHDGRALEDYAHPLWRFVERVAFVTDMMSVAAAEQRDELHRRLHALAEHVAAAAASDIAAPRWALERLAAWERERLEQLRRAASRELSELDPLEHALLRATPAPATTTAPLDENQLDTVPAVLMESLPLTRAVDVEEAARWVVQCAPGDWLRIFVRGRWLRTQWLGQSTLGEVALLVDVASGATCAVRRGALERLYAERLLTRLEPLSLVGRAAGRVQRLLEEARAA